MNIVNEKHKECYNRFKLFNEVAKLRANFETESKFFKKKLNFYTDIVADAKNTKKILDEKYVKLIETVCKIDSSQRKNLKRISVINPKNFGLTIRYFKRWISTI